MEQQEEPVSLSLIFTLLIPCMIFTCPSEDIDQRVFAQRRQETGRALMFCVEAVWFSVNVSIVGPSFRLPLSPSFILLPNGFPSCPLQTTKVKLEVDDSGERFLKVTFTVDGQKLRRRKFGHRGSVSTGTVTFLW